MEPDCREKRGFLFGGGLNEGNGAIHDDAGVVSFGVFRDGGAGSGEVIVTVYFAGIGVSGFLLFDGAGIDEGIPGGDF